MNKLMIALAVTAPAACGQEVSPPPAAVLQLEPYRKTVALRAKAGGHEGLFVFDTAGGISQLSLAFAERIGCKPWGRITGFQIMGQRLDMAQCGDVKVEMSGQAWRLPVVGVFDLMSLFSEGAQAADGPVRPRSVCEGSDYDRFPAQASRCRIGGKPSRSCGTSHGVPGSDVA